MVGRTPWWVWLPPVAQEEDGGVPRIVGALTERIRVVREWTMAQNPSFLKRQKEQARREYQAAKAEKKKNRPIGEKGDGKKDDGIDPDIAGIVPGPQPKVDE